MPPSAWGIWWLSRSKRPGVKGGRLPTGLVGDHGPADADAVQPLRHDLDLPPVLLQVYYACLHRRTGAPLPGPVVFLPAGGQILPVPPRRRIERVAQELRAERRLGRSDAVPHR